MGDRKAVNEWISEWETRISRKGRDRQEKKGKEVKKLN
jgi:hypothetical protein